MHRLVALLRPPNPELLHPELERAAPEAQTVGGVALFAYFVRQAGVSQIVEGIRRLGAGFVLILMISGIRHVVRSIAWMMCVEAPNRLRFRDALRARLMAVPPTVRASSSKSPAPAEPPAISMLFLGTIVSLV